MSNIFREFRCYFDNLLLAKASVDSSVEIKCKQCKSMGYFLRGTAFYQNKSTEELVQYNYTQKYSG